MAGTRERVERNIYLRHDKTGRKVYVIGYRDSDGRQRWQTVPGGGGITAARTLRDTLTSARGRGESVRPNPRLRFGQAADRWLAEQVVELRPATRASYESYVRNHLRPRWGTRRMDAIDVTDAARLVRELRHEGLAEWTISGILRAAGRVFKFARRHCGWHGENPIGLLEAGERARVADAPEPRPYEPHELEQTIAAAVEPWRTLFRLASVVGGRESELLGLWWEDLELDDVDRATVRFGYQVDRKGVRVPLKTDESKALLPLPRSTALMLLEHRARTPAPTGARAFVFAARTGRPLGQRNVLRALYAAQQRARRPDGTPTFPELFEVDAHGHLVVGARGEFVPRTVKRRELELPDFHALRHTAAMDCEDLEEARDLLRHKNSTVTAQVYRAHFSDRRRELLRARMEARAVGAQAPNMGARDRGGARQTGAADGGEVVDLQPVRPAAR